MAFTHPQPKSASRGKHRRPGRSALRTGTTLAGVAVVTATGGLGASAMAAPGQAEPAAVQPVSLAQALDVPETLADSLAAQADAQLREAAARTERAQHAREQAAAAAMAKAAAKAQAAAVHEARQQAARAAERKRLNSFVLPVAHSYVSTGYLASSNLWSSGRHTGIDFHAAMGTDVHAVGTGTVVEAGWGGSYGNNIVIRMADGEYTQYGHLSSIQVTVGQRVTPGQRIALSGATGNATGPHLHFEVRTTPDYGSDVDPVAYLRKHGLSV
jgi:murein DD-endopeptidase MepM/ murein hydrolase activator NlpD